MSGNKVRVCYHLCLRQAISPCLLLFVFTSCDRELNSVGKQNPCLLSFVFTSCDGELNSVGKQSPCLLSFVFTSCDKSVFAIISVYVMR